MGRIVAIVKEEEKVTFSDAAAKRSKWWGIQGPLPPKRSTASFTDSNGGDVSISTLGLIATLDSAITGEEEKAACVSVFVSVSCEVRMHIYIEK